MDDTNRGASKDGGGFLAGFVLGGVVGAAAAMLLAPQPGEETRDLVWGKAREASNMAKDATGGLRERVSSVAGDLQATAAELYERGRTVVDNARGNVDAAVDEGQRVADVTRNDLSSQSTASNSTDAL